MRRLAAVAAVASLAAAIAGCGGSPKAVGPLDDALGYFPKDAPFVAAVDTDLDGSQAKALANLVARVPLGASLVTAVAGRLDFPGVDFGSDIRPLLGDPLVVGVAHAPSGVTALRTTWVLAIHVGKPLRVKQLLLRQTVLLPKTKSEGRRIFENRFGGDFAAAVDGNVFVAGGSRAAVAQALAERRSGDRMRKADFDSTLTGLPGGAVVRVSADPRALIAAVPRLRPALSIDWIGALRRAGAAIEAAHEGIELDLHARTDAAGLSAADLPLASAERVPLFGQPGEIALGVTEPSRVAVFAARVAQALAPHGARRLGALLRAARARGVDLRRDFAAALGPTAAVVVDPLSRAWAVRVPLRDPAAVRASLQRATPLLPDVADALGLHGMGLGTPDQGASFYALARPHGPTIVFGVVGSTLVVANDPRRAATVAAEPVHPGATLAGALVASADTAALVTRYAVRRLPGIAAIGAPLAAGSLGPTTAVAADDRGGLRLAIKLSVR